MAMAMAMASEAQFRVGAHLRQMALERWLFPEEIYLLLIVDPKELGFGLTAVAPEMPVDGNLFLYGTSQRLNRYAYKHDNVIWQTRKKAPSKIQESFQTIKFGTQEVIRGVYCRAMHHLNFKRRVYNLLVKGIAPHILVHYRSCGDNEKIRGAVDPEVFRLLQERLVTMCSQLQQISTLAAAQLSIPHFPELNASNAAAGLAEYGVSNPYYEPEIFDDLMALSENSDEESSSGMVAVDSGAHAPAVPAGASTVTAGVTSLSSSSSAVYLPPAAATMRVPAAGTVERSDLAAGHMRQQLSSANLGWSMGMVGVGGGSANSAYSGGDHEAGGMSAAATHRSPFERFSASILDFAPTQSTILTNAVALGQTVGTKILICVSPTLPLNELRWPLYVAFSVVHDAHQSQQHSSHQAPSKVRVVADLFTNSVLRCWSPANPPFAGACAVWIEDGAGVQLTPKAEEFFYFLRSSKQAETALRAAADGKRGSNQLGKRSTSQQQQSRQSRQQQHRDSTSFASGYGGRHGSGSSRAAAEADAIAAATAASLASSSYGRAFPYPAVHSPDLLASDRETKIRIVEKLSFVKSALSHDSAPIALPMTTAAAPTAISSDGSGSAMAVHTTSSNAFGLSAQPQPLGAATLPMSPPDHPRDSFGEELPSMQELDAMSHAAGALHAVEDMVEGWLDDTQLSKLSDSELETLMDNYITTVVKQLVQMAAVDDDLREEIDSLDANGFSLLHYCCIYNLDSLIPVLLAKGATASKRAASGATALHLAAGAGHLSVVEILVANGASVLDADAANLLPSDRAIQFKHHSVYEFLVAAESSQTNSDHDGRLGDMSDEWGPLQYPHQTMRAERSGDADAHAMTATPMANSSPSVVWSPRNRGALNPPSATYQSPLRSVGDNPALAGKNMMSSPREAQPENETDTLTQRMLQDAFATLSLTDKCALSLSMGQINAAGKGTVGASLGGSNSTSSITTPRDARQESTSVRERMDSSATTILDGMGLGPTSGIGFGGAGGGGSSMMDSGFIGIAGQMSDGWLGGAAAAAAANIGAGGGVASAGGSSGGADVNNSLELEMQSVLSETDRGSLILAMSLMGPAELQQVDEEARKIQNNVRGWLMRKNYTNLREAARVLQGAWRVKRKAGFSAPVGGLATSMAAMPVDDGSTGPHGSTGAGGAGGARGRGHNIDAAEVDGSAQSEDVAFTVDGGPARLAGRTDLTGGTIGGSGRAAESGRPPLGPPSDRQMQAAATLQAATRAMIARRQSSFSSMRKQTMASLVIQKSLVRWWTHKSSAPIGSHDN